MTEITPTEGAEGADDARPIKLRRQPVKHHLPHDQRVNPERHILAHGYGVESNGLDGIYGFTFESYTWDCPACGSLLLASTYDSTGGTRDTDPVSCPVCGDASAYINSSGWPSTRVLIHSSERATEAEYWECWS
jgi:hypothetical protein